jgi:hypothetical protein
VIFFSILKLEDELEFFAFAIIFFYYKYIIFIIMRITESEKKEILSKYIGNTSDKLLTYLKRNFPTSEYTHPFLDGPIKRILVDDKLYNIEGNKKYLVNKILSYIQDDWVHLDYDVMRRTIKKFIDGNLL